MHDELTLAAADLLCEHADRVRRLCELLQETNCAPDAVAGPLLRAINEHAIGRKLGAINDELNDLCDITDRILMGEYCVPTGIDYRAPGRLVAWCWDGRRWVVLVEHGGPVTPWCVSTYHSGSEERGSGSYFATLSEAAAEWERRTQQ